jgi:hypothetical protein
VNCLDAETLAAWMDGGLSGTALEDVCAHVANCDRCQALLGAMGRTRAVVPAQAPAHSRRWWLGWAVPALAAATAIAIWVAIPQQRQAAEAPAITATAPATPAVPAPTPTTIVEQQQRKPAASPQPEPKAAAPSAQRPKPEARALKAPAASGDVAQSAPGSLNETVPFAPAAAPAARVQAAKVQPLCGAGWTQPPTPNGLQVAASSAPLMDVCWVAGQRGLVLRSTDRQTWQRINFPEMADLSAVTATDAQHAAVMTADGRTLSTADGGLTWASQ